MGLCSDESPAKTGHPADLRALLSRVGHTPMRPIQLRIGGLRHTVWLKMEGANPGGSSKDRTALGLVQDLESRGRLLPDSILVESTSGNLGVALALISRAKGYRFLAVVDPKIPSEILERMIQSGAIIDRVIEPDGSGGYLLSRLQRVRQICDSSPRFVWPNQYENPANPAIHLHTTAPEIDAQMENQLDAVFVAVSTGGTLAGVGRYFRQHRPNVLVIGVDAAGSVVFGGAPSPRKLNGIGSARRSSFLTPLDYHSHMVAGDSEAFAFCRFLRERTGISVGGSSGAVLSACSRYIAGHPQIRRTVCLCADDGDNYGSSIFSDTWLQRNGLSHPSLPACVEDAWLEHSAGCVP